MKQSGLSEEEIITDADNNPLFVTSGSELSNNMSKMSENKEVDLKSVILELSNDQV